MMARLSNLQIVIQIVLKALSRGRCCDALHPQGSRTVASGRYEKDALKPVAMVNQQVHPVTRETAKTE